MTPVDLSPVPAPYLSLLTPSERAEALAAERLAGDTLKGLGMLAAAFGGAGVMLVTVEESNE